MSSSTTTVTMCRRCTRRAAIAPPSSVLMLCGPCADDVFPGNDVAAYLALVAEYGWPEYQAEPDNCGNCQQAAAPAETAPCGVCKSQPAAVSLHAGELVICQYCADHDVKRITFDVYEHGDYGWRIGGLAPLALVYSGAIHVYANPGEAVIILDAETDRAIFELPRPAGRTARPWEILRRLAVAFATHTGFPVEVTDETNLKTFTINADGTAR